MSLSLISRPQVNYTGVGNVSRWLAAFNPQVFVFQRQDFVIGRIDASDTNHIFFGLPFIPTTDQRAAILNTNVYVKTALYDFTGRVTSMSGPGGSIITVEFFDGTEDNSGGFVNIDALFPAYNVNVRLKITGQQAIFSSHAADAKGFVRADVRSFVSAFTAPEDSNDYGALVYLDNAKFTKYGLSVSENWVGQSGSFTNIDGTWYSTHSALQLNKYGSNMCINVPFIGQTDPKLLAKFLTNVSQPVLYVGYPLDLGFINTTDFLSTQLYVRFTPLDINGVEVDGGLISSALLVSPGVRLGISEDGVLLISHPENVFPIDSNEGVNRLTVFDSYSSTVNFVDVYIFYLTGDPGSEVEHPITETKRIAVNTPCDGENIYVKWMNTLGGWDYELFNNKSEYAVDVTSVQILEREVLDYSAQDGTQDVLSKQAQPKVTIGKNDVPRARMEALAVMTYSNKVYKLMNENPYVWNTVIVDSKGVNVYAINNEFSDFEVILHLPALNIQTA